MRRGALLWPTHTLAEASGQFWPWERCSSRRSPSGRLPSRIDAYSTGGGRDDACGPGARRHGTRSTQLGSRTEFGGIYEAQRRGYFADERLKVEIIKGGPGVASPQLTATGAVEFGVVSGDQLVTLRAKGAPLVGVYACFDQFPRGIVVHEKDAPPSLEALWKSQRTVAVEPGHAFVKWLNHRYGGERLKLVPSQGGLAQFKRDAQLAQAIFIFAEPATLKLAGVPTKIFAVGESGYNPYSVLVATNETYLKTIPMWFGDSSVRCVGAGQHTWRARTRRTASWTP